jgi:hypothetical protein
MDVLPIPGDRVRVPIGPNYFYGVVANARNVGVHAFVTIEIHLPDTDEPYTATFSLEHVEPIPDDVEPPPGWYTDRRSRRYDY